MHELVVRDEGVVMHCGDKGAGCGVVSNVGIGQVAGVVKVITTGIIHEVVVIILVVRVVATWIIWVLEASCCCC